MTFRSLIQRTSFQLALVVLAGGIVYSNTFHTPFILDDFHVIVDNRRLDSLTVYFNSISWLDSSFKSRWFALATFAANKGFSGYSVAGFHAINLVIHIAAALAVFFLTKSTLASFGRNTGERLAFAPVLAALGFVLHPVHTQAVTYIVQRMTSLATLLCLCTVLFYSRLVQQQAAAGTPEKLKLYLLYSASFASCLLAMSTKEIAFTLPALLALFDLCFLKGQAWHRLFRLSPFIVCGLVMPFYLVGLERCIEVAAHGGGDAASFPLPRMTYLLTEFRVVMTYLRLLVIPVGQNLDYDYPVYDSLFQPQVAASLAVILLLIVYGCYLLYSSFKPVCRNPVLQRVAGFSILWFFITLSIESGVIPLIDTIFEHRVYLPSVWLFISVGILACELCQRSKMMRLATVLTIVFLLCITGGATYRRNQVWRDEKSLWTDVVSKSPGNARGWTNLGIHFVNASDYGRAVPLLEKAVSLNPGYYLAHCWLGLALSQQGDYDRALEQYLLTTQLAPGFSKGWEFGGRLLLGKKRFGEAMIFLTRAKQIDPRGFVSQEHLAEAEIMVAH